MEQTNTTPGTEPKGGMGPLIGSIIVIVILVIGAIYFWGGKLNSQDINGLSPAAVSTSDNPTDLEQDLNNIPDVPADINNL